MNMTVLNKSYFKYGGIAVAFILMFWFYYKYNPKQYDWFPQCCFYRITGLQCPSCGNQRALHALLNNEWETALSYNFFLIIALPYAVVLVIISVFPDDKTIRLRKYLLSSKMIRIYLASYLIWGVVRNIM